MRFGIGMNTDFQIMGVKLVDPWTGLKD